MEREALMVQAVLLLRDAGVQISGGSLDALSLTLPDHTVRSVRVLATEKPPTPSRFQAAIERNARILIVTAKPTAALSDAASTNKLDLISLTPPSVMIDGTELLERRDDSAAPVRNPHGRTPWGRLALFRALALADEPLTQQQLADHAGISQPAVNKHLKMLASFVDREPSGWKAHNVAALIDWWVNHYPGPGGVSSYWYSLKPPAEQARMAADFARALGASPLVSGDAAADVYAPWRLPDTVHLYLREAVDFTGAGFSPASKDEASMIATVPEDHTLWFTALMASVTANLPLADPLVTLRDVLAGGAVDSDEAAEHLRDAILSGTAR